MSEAQQQVALFKRARFNPVTEKFLYAIPNGGSRHKLEALNLKRQGVRPGVSDVCLAYPSHGWHSFYLELKDVGKTVRALTIEQMTWILQLREVDIAADVVFGWEEAWRKIENYLDGTLVLTVL